MLGGGNNDKCQKYVTNTKSILKRSCKFTKCCPGNNMNNNSKAFKIFASREDEQNSNV